MHHVNREMTTKYKNMKIKFTEEQLKTAELTDKLDKVTLQYQECADAKHLIEVDLVDTKSREEILKIEKERLEKSVEEALMMHSKLEKQFKEAMHDVEELRIEKVKFETHIHALEQYMTTKLSEQKNAASVLTHLTETREVLLSEVDALKMKNDRDRNKLKFYKGEYVGFEVHKKNLEDTTDDLKKQIRVLEALKREQGDTIKRLEESNILNEQLLSVLKRENDEFSEQAKISIMMRRDLEHRLKGQIEQTQRLQVKCEDQEKEIRDFKRKQLDLECEVQKETDERLLLDTRVNELEHQNEILGKQL